jgi:hypothetical protein
MALAALRPFHHFAFVEMVPLPRCAGQKKS